MKYLIIMLGLIGSILLLPNKVWSQNNLDNLLEGIAKNNKSIVAYNQLLEAKKLEYKTGLYLANPTLQYDYMKGTPANAGNQTDISAIQSFDFPTAYGKRKGVSGASIDKLDILANAHRQEILLETKLIYLELVYLNKYQNQLRTRVVNAEQFQKAIQQKYEKGDATLLDINKGKMNLITLQNNLRSNANRIAELNQKLTELNGGIDIVVADSIYPLVDVAPSLDSIFTEAVKGDYKLQAIQQDQEISQKEEQLSKALALPKLEAGYRYQSILGQNFNGFHAGISIPLFENRNKVQSVKQQTQYFSLLEASHVNQHHNELEALYNTVGSLKQSMDAYRKLLDNVNNEELLNRALQLGQISSIEYFMELTYFYAMYDDHLMVEQDYYSALATLMSYELR